MHSKPLCFNSKLVRLKVFQDLKPKVIAECSFNSKLVRLKAGRKDSRHSRDGTWFQFQTGAIKSKGENVIYIGENPFQFQTGAIKSGGV